MSQVARAETLAVALALLVVAAAPVAHAADAASHRAWSVRPEVLTDAPIHAGAGVLLELPGRVRVHTALGLLPESYVGLINDAVGAIAPGYSDAEAELVEGTLQRSLVWRTQVGWRPLPKRGLYLHLGYGMVTLGGDNTAEELLEGLTGRSFDEQTTTPPLRGGGQPSASGRTFTAGSTLHMLGGELGWEWTLWRQVSLRTGLAWSYTVAAQATVSADFEARTPAGKLLLADLERASEEYLVDTYRSYVHPPSVVVALGWALD